MKKKMTVAKYKKTKVWPLFSKYIRMRDALETCGNLEEAVCCTCGKIYPIFGKGCIQAGHYVAGRSGAVLFEEHGVHAQCYVCNCRLKGDAVRYRWFMIEKYGEEETERIEHLRNQIKKWSLPELEDLYKDLEIKIESLQLTQSNIIGKDGSEVGYGIKTLQEA